MDWLAWILIVTVAIAYIVGQRLVRAWAARRWAEERLSNFMAVLLIVLTSGIGLGVLIFVGLLIVRPSQDSLVALIPLLFVGLVVFGLGMTAINYASTHGVREHIRRQRERDERE